MANNKKSLSELSQKFIDLMDSERGLQAKLAKSVGKQSASFSGVRQGKPVNADHLRAVGLVCGPETLLELLSIGNNTRRPSRTESQNEVMVKKFKNEHLGKEINELILEIGNEGTEYLTEIKGFLRSELNRVKGGELLKTAEQQLKELDNRITRIEKTAHMHSNDILRHDDPPEQKEEILNRRAIPPSFLQQN